MPPLQFIKKVKVKLSFLSVGVIEGAILKVFQANNDGFAKMIAKKERSQSTYDKYKIVYNHFGGIKRLKQRVSNL